MKDFNISEWALKHPQMIAFLLMLLTVAGTFAYGRLGQKEDPDFTVKTMVVQAFWPGSSSQQMADQVADRIEKKLQEVAEIDASVTYVRPGETLVKINLREATAPRDVPDVWYQVRKKIGDVKHQLPPGVQGPFFNDEFGDTFGNLYAITGDGFSNAQLRQFAMPRAMNSCESMTSTKWMWWANRTRKSMSRRPMPSWPRWESIPD